MSAPGSNSQGEVGFLRAMLSAMLAVLAAFIGIRRARRADDDVHHLRPLQIIVAGILMVALFITVLLLIVQAVLPS